MSTNSNNLAETNNTDLLVEASELAALIVLENGGETSRAEETAVTICQSGGKEDAVAVAFPTAITISTGKGDGSRSTSVARIKSRNTNLARVATVNKLSRDYAHGAIDINTLHGELQKVQSSVLFTPLFIALASALSSVMFCLLLEDTLDMTVVFDMSIAFIGSFVAQLISLIPRFRYHYTFARTFFNSAIISAVAVLAVSVFGIGNISCIIIGAIMPLLPGVSLTNAIRDTVVGDIVSGGARILETLLIAIAISSGAGLVLAAYVNFFGGTI